MTGDDSRTVSEAERALEGRLTQLGPLLRAYARADSEIDPRFAARLRSRLVSAPARRGGARPLSAVVRNRQRVWAGVAAAGCTAVAAALLLAGVLSPHPATALRVPSPTRSDLLFNLPSPAAMVRQLSPTVSLVHPRPAAPYGGPLKLTAARLPPAPAVLQAHQLAPPLDVVPLGRILLGIRSRARHLMTAAGRWIAAVDGEDSPREHLHSLAVSLTSGEVIYHDRRNLDLPHAHAPVGRATAVAVARAWLTKLGWPGARMPLAAVDRAPGMARVRAVKFGWPGVGAAGVDAATLWVTPNRSVIEAWLWPPVMRHGTVSALPLSAAWEAVRSGRAPIAVPGAPVRARAPGSGSLLHAGVIAILSVRGSGRVFLVPAYRFEGRVHIAGASTHTWFSLAPGARSTR